MLNIYKTFSTNLINKFLKDVFFIFTFLIMYVSERVCACGYRCSQKLRISDALELELQAVMSCSKQGAGTELGSSARAGQS